MHRFPSHAQQRAILRRIDEAEAAMLPRDWLDDPTIKENTMETTRRHPRTLEEAFGPYQRGPVEDPSDRATATEAIVIAASLVAAIALGAMMLIGWVQ